MTPEHRLMNEVRLWCGKHDMLCFRCNVGTYLLANGTYMDTGLPVGFPDLLVLTDKGEAVFVECKVKPNKPTKEQLEFLNNVKRRGFKGGVVYGIEDFINLVNEPAHYVEGLI